MCGSCPWLPVLTKDKVLASYGITLDARPKNSLTKTPWGKWRWKNLDWNPSFSSPDRGPVSQVMLTLATANMNSCIHRDGLSAHVLWPQCNEFTS